MMRSSCTLRARRLAMDERGITLVEITVVIFLFGIVSAVVLAMFVSVTRGSTENNKINLDTRSASNGMNETVRMIRAATENPQANPAAGAYPNDPAVIAGATTTSVSLYAYVNLDSSTETPVMVTFAVNSGNQLVETKYPATGQTNSHWNFDTTPHTGLVLTDSIVPGSAVFSYFNGSNTVVPVPNGGIVDPTALLSIRSIQITLPVKSPGSTWSAITLQNTVGMPNLGLSRSGTGS